MTYDAASGAAARRDSLVGGGPLKLSNGHYLITALPQWVSNTSGGVATITQHVTEYIFLNVLTWEESLVTRNLAWYILATRVAKFICLADNMGQLKWIAFSSTNSLIQHLNECKAKMPQADQMLITSDVHAYPVPTPAASLFEAIHASYMRAADGAMTAAVDFKTIMADGYVASRRDDLAGRFQTMLVLLLHAAGDDLALKPLAVQAMEVCEFILKTQPPTPELALYLPYDKQQSIIATRAHPTASARFVPLLIAALDSGRDAGHPELQSCFPTACKGAEMVRFISLLSMRAGFGEDITDTICAALCDILRNGALADLDTPRFRTASNADRCRALGDIIAHAVNSKPDAGDVKDKRDVETMRSSVSFKAFIGELELLDTSHPNFTQVVQKMARTAWGRIYLHSGIAADPLLKKFAAARLEGELTRALSDVLGKKLDGSPLDVNVVLPGVAAKLIAAKFDGDFDFWSNIAKLVVEKRDGKFAANAISPSKKGFWADHAVLLLAEPICASAMEFIGLGGLHIGSYRSFHKGMLDRAYGVRNLPDKLKKKQKLKAQLAAIGYKAVNTKCSKDASMLREPAYRATIDNVFFPPDSEAANDLKLWDEDFVKAQDKVRLEDIYNDNEDDDFSTSLTVYDHKGGNKRDWDDSEWWRDYDAKHQKVEKIAGAKLKLYSAYLTVAGILFGNRYLVTLTKADPAELMAMKHLCLGQVCYGSNAATRAGWCSKKGKCKDHPRPDGLNDSDFEVLDLYAPDLSPASITIKESVLASKASWKHLAGTKDKELIMGRGQTANKGDSSQGRWEWYDRSKSINKGGGTGGKGGGKGKGKGKGEGKGKGKGKGKGGKGDKTNFGRRR